MDVLIFFRIAFEILTKSFHKYITHLFLYIIQMSLENKFKFQMNLELTAKSFSINEKKDKNVFIKERKTLSNFITS